MLVWTSDCPSYRRCLDILVDVLGVSTVLGNPCGAPSNPFNIIVYLLVFFGFEDPSLDVPVMAVLVLRPCSTLFASGWVTPWTSSPAHAPKTGR
jgi:hypothetical protein